MMVGADEPHLERDRKVLIAVRVFRSSAAVDQRSRFPLPCHYPYRPPLHPVSKG